MDLQVRRIELSRIGATGAVDPSLVLQLLLECELEGVTRLRCCEGMLPTWDAALFRKLEGLRILNLSGCQLSSLPPGALHLAAESSFGPAGEGGTSLPRVVCQAMLTQCMV